jgi:hypothetical protein
MCDGSVNLFSFELRRNPRDLHALIGPRDQVAVDIKKYVKK